MHKVLILGSSHARGCASEVMQQKNEFEIFGFINPGSGKKNIKGSAKMKMTQLTNKGRYSGIMGRCEWCCKNQLCGGHKTYIRAVDKFNFYQCDPIKCPSWAWPNSWLVCKQSSDRFL